MINLNEIKICIVGLGYVGLPLAVEFGKKYNCVGYDINSDRIRELEGGVDRTNEITSEELDGLNLLRFSSNKKDIKDSNVYIITVPTPIDADNRPDLTPLIKSSELIGDVVCRGDVVIYESTVYPGVTEDVCIPIIEKISGLKINKELYVGYSPERINPGDKVNGLTKIKKITSGSNEEAAYFIDELYKTIITAGTFKAASIKIAEAAKVVENVQRDVNIALMNELYQLFLHLNIDVNDVIDAAETKWNFTRVRPGLVGGHCIGVDPYYLLHKAQVSGYIPDLIRKSREINDSMPKVMVDQFIRELIRKKVNPIGQKIALLGASFKENCPDTRNAKSIQVYRELVESGFLVTIYDPIVESENYQIDFGIPLNPDLDTIDEEIAFLAVSHDEILEYIKDKDFKYIFKYK